MRAKSNDRQYDQKRLRVRPTLSVDWGPGAPQAEQSDAAQVEASEESIVNLMCEELHWTLEAEHREARLQELRCARQLQRTLHLAERALQAGVDGGGYSDAAGDLALVRTLHGRALRETRRLAELEDEWSNMRGDATFVRAVHARHRADIAARRCDDMRELLRRVPLEVRPTRTQPPTPQPFFSRSYTRG